MNKKETIADILFCDSPNIKEHQSVVEKYNFAQIGFTHGILVTIFA